MHINKETLVLPLNILIVFAKFSICIFCTNANAADGDVLELNTQFSKTYDNNIFRQSVNEQSDQISTTIIGARFDKSYGLQRFLANVSLVDYKYQNNTFLDFTAKNYSASWLWSLTPSLRGSLSRSQNERQVNFRDIQNPSQIVLTSEENVFRAEYSPFRVLSLILGYTDISTKNSQVFTIQAGNQLNGVDYGIQYNFSSGSNLALLGHRRRGEIVGRPLDFNNQFDIGFTDYEYDIEFTTSPILKSILIGKIGYLERQHDTFPLRDYDAIIGNLTFDWSATGKLRYIFNLSRSLGVFETNNSTYSITDSFSSTVKYTITDKIDVGLNLGVSERKFDGKDIFSTSGRTDTENSIGANLNWQPIKNIAFSLSSTKSNRNSTLSQFDFSDTLTFASINLKI